MEEAQMAKLLADEEARTALPGSLAAHEAKEAREANKIEL